MASSLRTPVLLASSVDESLERVRLGLETRARDMARRVGNSLGQYIYRPGKMLRARFCLLLGQALGVDPAKAEICGRVAELVHNASLLHDDCIDEADLRRGNPTPNALFGKSSAILLGDLAFAEALDEVFLISPEAARGIADAVREMTIGELQEEFLRGSVNVSIESYLGVAARKTGALFEWCGQAMSHLSPLPHDTDDPPKLGRSAGILLQIVDDIHDFTLDEKISGKDQGKDLDGGWVTLPVLLALQNNDHREEALKLWQGHSCGPEGARELARFLDRHGYLEESKVQARGLLKEIFALSRSLPHPPGVRALEAFLEAMAWRQF